MRTQFFYTVIVTKWVKGKVYSAKIIRHSDKKEISSGRVDENDISFDKTVNILMSSYFGIASGPDIYVWEKNNDYPILWHIYEVSCKKDLV